MSYIIPRFIGRLGNNLWQIATAIAYAKKHNIKWGIKKGYIEKGFQANQVDKFLPHLPASQKHDCKTYTEWQKEWEGREFNYHEIPYFSQGIEIVGFWQSWKYLEGAHDEIRKWFNISYTEGLEYCCSIHIRRGDYTQHSGSFPPVTTEYIYTAAAQVILRSGTPRKWIVFSDDIAWCKESLKHLTGEVEYSEGRNEWEDLCLMASCGHNIIANSSFSWWAGWLNRNPNKVVVSPSHKRGNWFGMEAGIKHDCVDLIPDEWVQIKFR